MRSICIIALTLITSFLFAAEKTDKEKLSHESEAGVILASGNSETQTYNVKQETSYGFSKNTIKFTGSYLLGKNAGVQTAKKWDLGLRYDRALSDNLSIYSSYQIDSLPFAGTQSRHTVDLGGKYSLLKDETHEVDTEFGYRLTKESFTSDNGVTSTGYLTSHMSRLYFVWNAKWNESISSKLWTEYLQSYTNTKDYRFNLEPSLSMVLTKVFSIKLAYLVNFRNVPAVAGKKTVDTLYTTSLVAKF